MRFRLEIDGERRDIEIEPRAGGFEVRVDGARYRVRARSPADTMEIRIGAKGVRVQLQGETAILDDGVHRFRISEVSETAPTTGRGAGGAGSLVDVRAPMPGRVVRVNVTPGAGVRRGQTLIVLEAMKMQNEIPSPGDGVVREIRVAAGETVTADAIVASIELRGPSAS
ncbi:MAG: biotin/lipoyl-binding protein [Methanobacteriota archaeon]|nr:MAG: biotin/lipoyl-binding protein [Euryarchaeota archaeon]